MLCLKMLLYSSRAKSSFCLSTSRYRFFALITYYKFFIICIYCKIISNLRSTFLRLCVTISLLLLFFFWVFFQVLFLGLDFMFLVYIILINIFVKQVLVLFINYLLILLNLAASI